MVPNREIIQSKINEFLEDERYIKLIKLGDWLDEVNCPNDDRLKILSDLESYANY